MRMYYILSLKWSKDKEEYVWWCPDNNGYTVDLNSAGQYPEDLVKQKPDYYDNGSSTLAIPVEVVEQTKKMTVIPSISDNYNILGIKDRLIERGKSE